VPDFQIIRNTRIIEHISREHNNLSIGKRGICSDKFYTELPELAISAFLWALVPEAVSKVAPA
jgi:hypothetical protein